MDTPDLPPTFDTLAIVQQLEAAGVERKQAEAQAEALRNSQARLATGDDIARLEAKVDAMKGAMATKTDLAELRADIYRALWLQGAGLIAIIVGLKLFG